MKVRLEKYDDQAYFVYAGLGPAVGRIFKQDGNWIAKVLTKERKFHYRVDAANWCVDVFAAREDRMFGRVQ